MCRKANQFSGQDCLYKVEGWHIEFVLLQWRILIRAGSSLEKNLESAS